MGGVDGDRTPLARDGAVVPTDFCALSWSKLEASRRGWVLGALGQWHPSSACRTMHGWLLAAANRRQSEYRRIERAHHCVALRCVALRWSPFAGWIANEASHGGSGSAGILPLCSPRPLTPGSADSRALQARRREPKRTDAEPRMVVHPAIVARHGPSAKPVGSSPQRLLAEHLFWSPYRMWTKVSQTATARQTARPV